MTLQEMIQSLDALSRPEQRSLLAVLQAKLSATSPTSENGTNQTFWQGVVNFRAVIQREGLTFTDEDFANLRDHDPGREISL